MKNKLVLFLVLILLVFITGCEKSQKSVSNNAKRKGYKELKCVARASDDGIGEKKFSYKAYHDGKYMTLTDFKVTITSNDTNYIDTYRDAYQKIKDNYEGIRGYKNILTSDDNKVVFRTIIDYTDLDVEKVIAIEGRENNIFTADNKYLKDTFIKFSKEKAGVVCTEKEDE